MSRSLIRRATRIRALGSAMIESSICLFVITVFGYMGLEGLRLTWLASTAQLLASTAAQIGSVAQPADSSGAAPEDWQLKIGTFPYLASWRSHNWYFVNGQGGVLPPLDFMPGRPNARAINLALGLSRQYLPGYQTAQVYTGESAWQNVPLPNNQFYIVPIHWAQDNAQATPAPVGPTHYMTCIGTRVVLLGLRKICRDSMGNRSWL